MEIIQATPAHAEAIVALRDATLKALAGGDPALASAMSESDAQLRYDIRTRTVLVAMEDGQMVGTLRGHMEGGTCFVDAPLVAPDHLGRDVVERLLSAIESVHGDALGYSLNTVDLGDAYLQPFFNQGYRRHAVLPGHGGPEVVFLRKPNGAAKCVD